jgi:hypothetical protein
VYLHEEQWALGEFDLSYLELRQFAQIFSELTLFFQRLPGFQTRAQITYRKSTTEDHI